MRDTRILNNQFGFALVQSLAVLGVVGIVGAATLSLNQDFIKSARFAQSQSDLTLSQSLLHQLVDGPTSCTSALRLDQSPVSLAKLKNKNRDGTLAGMEVSIYFSGKVEPLMQSGQKLGVMQISSILLSLRSVEPVSALPSGAYNYRASIKLVGNRASSFGSGAQEGGPIPIMLLTDAKGLSVVGCSSLNQGEGLPICPKGKVINSSDNNNLVCVDVPRSQSPLSAACAKSGGVFTSVPSGSKREDICIIASDHCPSGMVQLGHWSAWSGNTCFSGSTTGCNLGKIVTVSGHSWQNYVGSMSDTVVSIPDEFAACGPLFDGRRLGGLIRKCYAKNIKIGCTLAPVGGPKPPPTTTVVWNLDSPNPPPPPPAGASVTEMLNYVALFQTWFFRLLAKMTGA